MAKHEKLQVVGLSVSDCLRKLEKEAGLPAMDLFVADNMGTEVVGWPVGSKATKHIFISQTSENIKLTRDIQGYFTGSVLKSEHPIVGIQFGATMHISKNCPGVYSNGVCTSCGHIES